MLKNFATADLLAFAGCILLIWGPSMLWGNSHYDLRIGPPWAS